ncbi:YbjN domain-containing protein [Corynebacterium aquilae]|uniref:Uncharacterized protein n=1 Tax=Corynebacterium aquilae DSM 44791 TaxID=1431546 RepID=A0A1L7CDB7_9CORY|nr:YbjN domain-containing protein [Corynebacterium aquilae]APT83814.1 hypothetical protein CAQU_00480 [Corynebacterium aquilae DSM 44791]
MDNDTAVSPMIHQRLAALKGCADEGDYVAFTVEGQEMYARFDDQADTVTVWGFWDRPLTPADMPLAKAMANRINTGELAPRVSLYTSKAGVKHLLCDMAVSTAVGITDDQLDVFLHNIGSATAAAVAFFDETYRTEMGGTTVTATEQESE